ncbi:hypothetical protein MKW94_021392, partial [Papaver nudicaule]|nr:hypothetical protein [Papaver nudicaule]
FTLFTFQITDRGSKSKSGLRLITFETVYVILYHTLMMFCLCRLWYSLISALRLSSGPFWVCNFGPEFTVVDVDGDEPHTGIIASISNDSPALVSCFDDDQLEFQDGDLVVFSEGHGMTELNDGKPRKVKKMPDLTPLNLTWTLKILGVRRRIGTFPCCWVRRGCTEADFCLLVSRTINEKSGDNGLEEIDENWFEPHGGMIGGIVGQEVVNACSGKFHPLYQFFYFDSVESLPAEPLDPNNLKPVNCHYDAQISVFGSSLRKKLEESKAFMVGSGALGFSCNSQGKLTITDDDVIEKSNHSRQFLFRYWNIGQAKSTVATSSINPHLHIEALQNRTSPETESVFNDAFWENLNIVVNFLDNLNARIYMDQKWLYFQKPLLESGTLGAKCNTQMVIPHLTKNYGASRDPPEKQAPMCTVHSFPHNIDHCLMWACSEFEGLLAKTPTEVNSYFCNPTEYINAMKKAGDAQARENLERVIECLDRDKCEAFQDCLTWARLNSCTFPEGASTSSGARFWSARKCFPRPLEFSVDDPSHLQFIMAASILRAETFGILIPDYFLPKEGVNIVTDEKATNLSSASIDDASVINDLTRKVEDYSSKLPFGFPMNPVRFEKDDDTNYHMDLIAGFANMRARNYSIPEVDKLKAKFIAGRIIPAIATSTAMATGLVCLELYKVIDGAHKVEDYRNTFANLALPLFSMQEYGVAVWDRWVLRDNPNLRELMQWLKDKGLNAYSSISCGTSLLFHSLFPRHKDRMDRKLAKKLLDNPILSYYPASLTILPAPKTASDRKVVDLAWEVAKVEIPPYRRHVDVVVACEDDDDNDIDIPLVSVYFRTSGRRFLPTFTL